MILVDPLYSLTNYCKISLSPFDNNHSLTVDFSDHNFIILSIISTGQEHYGKTFLDNHLLKRKLFFFEQQIYKQNNIDKAVENIKETSMFGDLSTHFITSDYDKNEVLNCIGNQKDDLALFLKQLFQISLAKAIDIIKKTPVSKNFIFHQDTKQIEIGDYIIQDNTYERLLKETKKVILDNHQKASSKLEELNLYQEKINFILNQLNNKDLTKEELFNVLIVIDKELNIRLDDILLGF